MKLIDSHCHLNRINLQNFKNDMANLIGECYTLNVKKFLCVCVEPEDIEQLKSMAESYPDIYTSVGMHPNTELDKEYSTKELIDLASYPDCIAIGETGLDYYRTETQSMQAIQKARFATHINAAINLKKPLIIHTRAAAEDTIDIMRAENANDIGGVMHCFTEDWSVAKKALDLGFYISFSGIVTFKNAKVIQDVAQKVPDDRFLIETDCPYLAPEPFRGKENNPTLLPYIAKKLAELRGVDLATIAKTSTQNFYNCFKLT